MDLLTCLDLASGGVLNRFTMLVLLVYLVNE